VLGKKTGGTNLPPIGTEIMIPVTAIRPRDPKNNVYPPAVNKSAFPSLIILGRRTPSIGWSTFLKSSWLTPAMLTSLISAFDVNGDGDMWSWLINDGTTGELWSERVFDGCRGVMLSMSGSGAGGGIALDYSAIAMTAQGTTTFATPTGPDCGYEIDVSEVDFGATPSADLVTGWRLNAVRGGSYDMFYNGSLYPSGSSSGMLGGNFQLEQSPKYTVSPGAGITVRLGPIGSPILTVNALLNNDEDVYDVAAGFGSVLRTYTLIDTIDCGNPLGFS
jgi:hypothetical protein